MNEFTCRIVRGKEEVFISSDRGIAPLVYVSESGLCVKDCVAYDKIVGKAAALLYVLMGVKEVHAEVMSRKAQEVLREHGIAATCKEITEHIVNRRGDGVCPMERAVENISEPQEALIAIKKTLGALKGANKKGDEDV